MAPESLDRTTTTKTTRAWVPSRSINLYAKEASSEDTDDDDEDIEDYGISSMLVEPTQDGSQETEDVFSDSGPEHDLSSRIESESPEAVGHGFEQSKSDVSGAADREKYFEANLDGMEGHSPPSQGANDKDGAIGWKDGLLNSNLAMVHWTIVAQKHSRLTLSRTRSAASRRDRPTGSITVANAQTSQIEGPRAAAENRKRVPPASSPARFVST